MQTRDLFAVANFLVRVFALLGKHGPFASPYTALGPAKPAA